MRIPSHARSKTAGTSLLPWRGASLNAERVRAGAIRMSRPRNTLSGPRQDVQILATVVEGWLLTSARHPSTGLIAGTVPTSYNGRLYILSTFDAKDKPVGAPNPVSRECTKCGTVGWVQLQEVKKGNGYRCANREYGELLPR